MHVSALKLQEFYNELGSFCDFETTTDPKDCRVWAWAVALIEDPEQVYYGNSIKTFMNWLSRGDVHTAWFHNLAFDGKFILDYLLRCGYTVL